MSAPREIKLSSVHRLRRNKRNSRSHSKKQIRQIASSIRRFGWTYPVLTDENNIILAGHGRYDAALQLGLREVPIIVLSGLSDAEKRALTLADNQIATKAGWDRKLLAEELGELAQLLPECNLDLLAAGSAVYSELENIVVWAKTNAGQGSFYRSQHEFVFVYKSGDAPHINNIELGRHGRNGCRARGPTCLRPRDRSPLCRRRCEAMAGLHQAGRNPQGHRPDVRRGRRSPEQNRGRAMSKGRRRQAGAPRNGGPRFRSGGSYTTGYGKPPKEHRFQPGQSGNPKGRPRGTKNTATMLRDILDRKIEVRTGSAVRKISVREAILTRFAEGALKGDTKSAAFLLHRYDMVETAQEHANSATTPEEQEIIDADLKTYFKNGGDKK